MMRSLCFLMILAWSGIPIQFVQAEEIYGIKPLENIGNLNMEKVRLGKRLFHDVRLSKDNSISCAHCHGLDTGGVDNLKHSFGVNGAEGGINSPTVYNAALNIAQFWDGRVISLEEQASGPVHNPVEMGSNWKQVMGKLSIDADYPRKFKRLYGEPGLTPENIVHAIAEFERSLITVGSRFDLYLQGQKTAITKREKQGFELFHSYGCTSCHQGANVGGNMYQVMGAFGDYFADRGNITAADDGRFTVTKRESDRRKFKVPSLRLVTLTAPYFHDGSVETLEGAIKVMGQYQLGRDIPDEEVELIKMFLATLVGEMQTSGVDE